MGLPATPSSLKSMRVPSRARSFTSGAMSPTASGARRSGRLEDGGARAIAGSDRDRRALAGARPGDAAKDRARGEAGAAGIVEIEEPAHQLAGGVEAGN